VCVYLAESSGMWVVQRTLFNTALYLFSIGHCLHIITYTECSFATDDAVYAVYISVRDVSLSGFDLLMLHVNVLAQACD